MGKFRKKPIVVYAVQWIGGIECEQEIKSLDEHGGKVVFLGIPPHEVSIETLEGTMKANFNDWVIKGAKGELYPCKPDIFEATYEVVE